MEVKTIKFDTFFNITVPKVKIRRRRSIFLYCLWIQYSIECNNKDSVI
uniref:Uncharacterized protein n=1 Tax=Lepeophtheirus salmonis TaxID=72036 RepID=A0A0K2TFE7_LEPSM